MGWVCMYFRCKIVVFEKNILLNVFEKLPKISKIIYYNFKFFQNSVV